MIKYPKNEKKIEKAVKFLVYQIDQNAKNPKPIVFHSLKVGIHLYNLGYDKDIVIGGVLHDVLEDADVDSKEVEKIFGKNVKDMVEANSFDYSIKDKTERYKENFKRCSKAGKGALVIKAADFYDNCGYYQFALDKSQKMWLLKKLKYFIDNYKNVLKDEIIFNKLTDKYKIISKNLI